MDIKDDKLRKNFIKKIPRTNFEAIFGSILEW